MAPTYGSGPPLIGITTDLQPARWADWVREATLLPTAYVRAVERARAVPVLVPPTVRAAVPTLVQRLDGLIVSGGGDVDPALYGEAPHPQTRPPQPHRDRFESALLRAAIDADLPFLAVGRGMQLLNVLHGGGLIQHLPEVVGGSAHAPVPGGFGWHPVRIAAGGLLAKVLGDHADVPTGHHQAVRRLGRGLVPVAWAGDRMVEAVELQGHRFGLGVQWHPEEADDPRLLAAFTAAAAERNA